MKNSKRHNLLFTRILLLVAVFVMISAGSVFAAGKSTTVKPSGRKDTTDVKRVIQAMKKYKTVKLQKGKKYYFASPLHLTKSNRTLIATGATIVAPQNILVTDFKKANYSNLKNVTIKGGTWTCSKKSGYSRSSISIVHSSGITFEDMTIKHTNYKGHALELVACKDVEIKNVKIQPVGKPGSSQEAMIQLDIATVATYPRFKGTKFANGAVCKNVTIENCTVTGGCGLDTGYDYKEKKYINSAHTDINLINNTFIGQNSDGALLINVQNAVLRGNTIISNYSDLSQDKSTGLHFLVIGNINDTSLVCDGNTVQGGKYGIRAYSSGSAKLGTVSLTNNVCYSKNGAESAIQAASKGINNLTEENNQTYKW